MALTRRSFTPSFAREIVTEYGGIEAAARAFAPLCESERNNGRVVSWSRVKEWIREAIREDGIPITRAADPERLNRIAELLEKANIDPASINSIRSAKVKAWGYAMKGPDGEPIEGGLHATELTLETRGPVWPVADKAKPTQILYRPAPQILRKTRTVAVISDAQIGFLVDPETKEASPIHDPSALDVAKQIVAAIQPDELVFIGDWMDWPFLSRWQQHDEFDAVNESIQAGHRELAEFISAAGRRCKKRVMIGSNHQVRPEKFLLENNRKAMRVRRAADTSAWPVFSEPYLLRYEDLGIEFSGQYPGGAHYILPDLVATHAPPKVKEFAASVIHGHTHKLTRSTHVIHGYSGRQQYFTYDIGCLCQTGSTNNPHRLLVTNTPSDRPRTDWAQGIAVVSIVDGDTPRHAVEQIGIEHGFAQFRGQSFSATVLEAA